MNKFFLMLCMCVITLTLNAKDRDSEISTSINKSVGDYNIVSAGYDLMFLNADNKDDLLYGFNVQLVHGFKLDKKVPLYLETGIGLTYDRCKYINVIASYIKENGTIESFYDKNPLNTLRVYVPLNIGYRFITSPSFSILPYTGFSVNINPVFDYEFKSITYGIVDTSISSSMFSVDSTTELGNIRWQVGIKGIINKFLVGAQYSLDLIPLAHLNSNGKVPGVINVISSDKLRTANLTVSIGYVF